MTTAELINKLSCYNPSKQVMFRTKSGKMLDIKDVSLFVFYDDNKEDVNVITEYDFLEET